MSSVLDSTLTPAQAARSLLLAHYELQNGLFFDEITESQNGIFATSKSTGTPMWNHAAWLGGGTEEFQSFLSSLKQMDSARFRRPVVYLCDASPGEVEALKAGGFEKFDEEAWMLFAGETIDKKCAFEVSPVATPAQQSEFLAAFQAAYQTRDGAYTRVLKQHKTGAEHFILWDQGKAVSVGTIVSNGSTAFLYNVGTPPPLRGKGYAGALVKHLVAVAKAAGCERIGLQVDNNSAAKRLYEKLGFQTCFTRHGYRLASWKESSPGRTPLSNVLGSASLSQDRSASFLREGRPIPAETIARIQKCAIARGLRDDVFHMGALASVLARYLGQESVAFNFDDGNRRVAVARTDRSQPVLDWLAQLGESSNRNESADEILLRVTNEEPGHFKTPAHPLEISVVAGQAIEIDFSPAFFTKDAIRRLAGHYTTALQSLVENLDGTLADVEILSPREKHQLLVEWNLTRFVPTHDGIQELFESQVERTPDAAALRFARSGYGPSTEALTYRQLNRKANKLAHRLKRLGVGADVYVGVCLPRSLDMIVTLLAIFKAGGACVPLDPAYPAERLRFMVQDTNAPVVITVTELQHLFGEQPPRNMIRLDAEWDSISKESEKNPAPSSGPEHAAYVIYTSGSTGQPKGVVIPNRAIANHSIDCRAHYGLSAHDRVLQFSSFNFDASFEQILPPLISGTTLVVRDNEVWTLPEFGEKLRDFQLTVADIPTAYFHELAERWAGHPEEIPAHVLRLVIVGGEALSPEKLRAWLSSPLKDVRLINAYGPTETTITALSYEVPRELAPDQLPVNMPVGRPRGDRKIYILDHHGVPTPIGVPGELHIGGSLLALGYLKRNELTQSRFIQNPFTDDPDARIYRTGDLVRYCEDGNVEFLGRIDDQVKIRGFRIELGEIECALRLHPAVIEPLVLAREDRHGDKRLAAYLLSRDPGLNPREIQHFLRKSLPEYMIPGIIVPMEKWPLLPNGKIDRRALPMPEIAEEPATVNGPRDPLELQLQLLFERILKRAPIGIDASFFELGGDSLQALELIVEIEKATGKNLPLGTLYQSSTVESLAREVRNRSEGEEWSALVPLQRTGSRPPLFLLHTTPGDILGYGNLVYRLSTDQPCHGFQSLGLNKPELSHTRVEDMADYYLTLLRAAQPKGPYYLGGWCYGGIVAVEMARRLKEQGEEIGLLALLETVAMPPGLGNFKYYLHRIRCSLRMPPARWGNYIKAKAKYARDSRLANRMRFRQAAGTEDANLNEIDPRLAKLEHVYNTNLKALNKYRTKYFDGKVTLFNAQERDEALIPDEFYGWVGLAREIEIIEVPGNHDTMLTEPNVTVLAGKLEQALLAAQRRTKQA